MAENRLHRVVSEDGTEIRGTVWGQGPPLVFIHGVTGDGEVDWRRLRPLLADRFTCYSLSTRGRGLSGDSSDYSRERHLQDVTSFVESVGEPVGLVGLSAGGALALRAAAVSPAVSAAAVYEPALVDIVNEEDGARFREGVTAASEAVADGRLADGIRAFSERLANDEEMAALSASGYFDDAAADAPALVQQSVQGARSQMRMGDPSTLAEVRVPLLVMHGSRTAVRWFTEVADHVGRHVPDARVREIPGTGHFGPIVEPERVAGELVGFFDRK